LKLQKFHAHREIKWLIYQALKTLKLTERVIQVIIVVYGINVVNIVELDAIYVVELQLLDIANQGGPFSLM
jgi:hypothetical protein